MTRAFDLGPMRPVQINDLVRLGSRTDGGYVIAERSITSTQLLVALGINVEWSFEEDFISRNPGTTLLALDGSVSVRRFTAEIFTSMVQLLKSAMSFRSDAVRQYWKQTRGWLYILRAFKSFFYRPRRRFLETYLREADSDDSVSWATLRCSPEFAALQPLSVFVKMDIEGGEYRVLDAMLADADLINAFAIEFHDCDLVWERFMEIVARMKERFAIVHVHGNNCTPLIANSATPRTLEVSFVNRAVMPMNLSPATGPFPLKGLDFPNSRSGPDYPLQF